VRCRKANAIMREKTLPYNFHVVRRLLCTGCGNKLGFAEPYPRNERGSVLRMNRAP
jgi:hypothetical protein